MNFQSSPEHFQGRTGSPLPSGRMPKKGFWLVQTWSVTHLSWSGLAMEASTCVCNRERLPLESHPGEGRRVLNTRSRERKSSRQTSPWEPTVERPPEIGTHSEWPEHPAREDRSHWQHRPEVRKQAETLSWLCMALFLSCEMSLSLNQ